jgi:hypothetical protein
MAHLREHCGVTSEGLPGRGGVNQSVEAFQEEDLDPMAHRLLVTKQMSGDPRDAPPGIREAQRL